MVHEFYAITFNGFPITKYRCANCGLKVNRRAAIQLEGLSCA